MSTLKVFGGWEHENTPDFSPYCLKLKTYLRMIGVEYEAELGDPRKAPTKKIPFIKDGDDTVGDSGLILQHLKKKHGDKLDEKLTKEEHALGHLVRRTVEESLYWPMVQSRWGEDESWKDVEKMLLPLMPPVIGGLIAGSIRKGTLQSAYAQGVGRHTRDHIYDHGKNDIDAIATILGEKQFILGDAPTSYDASVYGMFANLVAFPKDGVLAKHVRTHDNLVAYLERMKTKYWATADKKAKKPD